MNFYNDIDPFVCAWIQELINAGHIAPGVVDNRSIEDIRPDELMQYTQVHMFCGIAGWAYALDLAGWPRDRPVWTGSCPCQPFSAAGKGAGFEDERHLWPAWQHLIAQCRPPVVFGEQVEGPASRAWLDLVCSDLEGLGYTFGAAVIPASSIGAPQLRHRTWFVADADRARWEGAERLGQQNQARTQWQAARREPLRPDCGSWPPGPREVHRIPVRADGIPGALGGCKGYGNAIVPGVAAEFVQAYVEACGVIPMEAAA